MRSVVVIGLVTIAIAIVVSSAGGKGKINPIRAENARAGTTQWISKTASQGRIEGYTSAVSIAPGESVEVHVSTKPAARYRVEIYRLGWYNGAGGRLIRCAPSCSGYSQGVTRRIPSPNPKTGKVRAGWPVDLRIPSDSSWTSGYYVARLVLTAGSETGRAMLVPFVVRSPANYASAILVQAPVNTWEAYNPWGGKSLYEYNSTHRVRANRVSFDRPHTAFSTAGPLLYEYPLVRYLEQRGYDVSYTTDVDVDINQGELLRHRLIIVPGHSEYWTKGMRDAFDAALAAGTNLAFTGSNDAYWQIRYEDGRRTIVSYKSRSDPVSNPALKTIRFRDLTPPRPECRLIGIQYLGGKERVMTALVDYKVNGRALHNGWFAKTGFRATSVLKGLVGTEWDAVQPHCPVPHRKVLFQTPAPIQANAARYTASSRARIFASGSLRFAIGLDDWSNKNIPVDPRLRRFMRNTLADLTRPAPPRIRVRRGAAPAVVVTRSRDPRIRAVRVYRLLGAKARFTSPHRRLICTTTGGTCVDGGAPRHVTIRYAAVSIDAWSSSVATLSAPIRRR